MYAIKAQQRKQNEQELEILQLDTPTERSRTEFYRRARRKPGFQTR